MVRWLIHDKFKLDTKPFPMYDEDSFIYLQGKGVRRSEFRADMFDFDLTADEHEKTPHELLKDTVQPLIDIMHQEDEASAWNRLLSDHDKYSLLSYLKERNLSDGALSIPGPLPLLPAGMVPALLRRRVW